eukprot:UN11047
MFHRLTRTTNRISYFRRFNSTGKTIPVDKGAWPPPPNNTPKKSNNLLVGLIIVGAGVGAYTFIPPVKNTVNDLLGLVNKDTGPKSKTPPSLIRKKDITAIESMKKPDPVPVEIPKVVESKSVKDTSDEQT